MTDTAVREAISAAVNTVEGFNCSPWFKQTTRTGDAIVSYAGSTRSENGFGYMNRWQVLVILPADIANAEKYLTDHLDALITAVESELIVQTVTPSTLTLDVGTVPGVVIEGVRARS